MQMIAEVVVARRVLRVGFQDRLVVFGGLGRPPKLGQDHAELIVGLVELRIDGQGLVRMPSMAPWLSPFSANSLPTSSSRYISAAGTSIFNSPSGGMLTNSGMFTARLAAVAFVDQDRRAVAALFIQVRQEHLRVGRAALRGEDQPAAVGRKAVPGVHQRRVAPHPPRRAALDRHDVQLAVGPHQLAVAALHEDDPAAVGRDLGKGIAHAVVATRRRSAPAGRPRPPLKGIR